MSANPLNTNPPLSQSNGKKIQRTIREQIVDRLRQDVLSGRFAAGERLVETQLAQEFGVSRGPIRDALLQLTQEGVLLYKPNCGVEVAPEVSDRLRKLFVSLRRDLEVFSLRTIFPEVKEPDLQEWGGILEQLRLACEQQELGQVAEHDMAFHRWILWRTHQPDLLAVWLPLCVRIRLVYSRHNDLREVYPEHQRVFEAVKNRDLKRAVKALEANIV